ncbi:CD3337/EF1877 family mobilome membrane protein [Niallia sp. 03133]|uniref:CD3337/EF1877 family mobilome membrane protein n=1 Tax=Niallia sp. 03133 TaxID=3458060 RepID=UPI00404479B5
MKFLKQGWCFFFLFFILPLHSAAEESTATVEKKEETVGRVIVESKEYPLDHYKMESDVGDGITEVGDRGLHSINQGMWGLNKTVASFTLYAVEELMSFDLISKITEEAALMSERIYRIMSGTFLSLFIVLAGGSAAWRYYVRGQSGYAVKAILGALIIMTMTFWFYSNAIGHIKWLNDRGAELEGIAGSVNVLMSSEEFDANKAYDSKEGIAVLENQLFNLMIKRPYLFLNYGSTKESELVKEDPNRVDKLLEIKPFTEEGKEQRKDVVDQEVSELENKQMSPDFSGERFGYLIVTLLSTIAVSVPVLLLASFKFLLQVWFLALVIFTAIPLVLSLIPAYSETALNHGKKLMGVLLLKAGLVLLIGVITGLVTLLYESVSVTNGVEGYVFVVFLVCITIWGLFKYRSEIFEVASSGMVHGQQRVERATLGVMNRIGDVGEKGVGQAKRMVGTSLRENQQNHEKKQMEKKRRKTLAALEERETSSQREAVGDSSLSLERNDSKQRKVNTTLSTKQGNGMSPSGFRKGTISSFSHNDEREVIAFDRYKKEKGRATKEGVPSGTAAKTSSFRKPKDSAVQAQENNSGSAIKITSWQVNATGRNNSSENNPSSRDPYHFQQSEERSTTTTKKVNGEKDTSKIRQSRNREPKKKMNSNTVVQDGGDAEREKGAINRKRAARRMENSLSKRREGSYPRGKNSR